MGKSRYVKRPMGNPVDQFSMYVGVQHTDLSGRLFVAVPMFWASTGWENLVRAVGRPIDWLMMQPVKYPVAHVTLDHFKALSLGDQITVTTGVTEVGSRSVHIECLVHREGESAPSTVVRRIAVATGHGGDGLPAEDWVRAMAPAASG